MDELISEFVAETREGLEALDSALVQFEQRPDDPQTLDGVFRLVHTIKGACGFLGLVRLQTVAHAAENVLGAFRDGELAVTPMAVTAVLDTVDLIRTLTEAVAASGVEPEGEDSALIARLEAVLEGGVGVSAESPAAESPIAVRPLIERLGGDASLDAAAEMAVERLAGRLGGADPLAAQGALRDSLITAARRGERPQQLLNGVGMGEAFAAVAAALSELDIDDAAVAELRAIAAPEDLVEAAEATKAEPPKTASTRPSPQAGSPVAEAQPAEAAAGPAQTIRVSVDALEHLMTVVSELVLIRNQLIQTLRLQPESPFAAPLNRLNQVTSELQEGVMTTRMQPIGGAWAKLPRLVRDLAQDLGKSIDLVLLGQETELDRQVLELIKDPLTHMIRNAADHGLETRAERRAQGKSETGRITLAARHEGGAIVIEISDDGRGLSPEKIRNKAVAAGVLTAAQAEQMSDADTRQLIFMPGFSTAAQVTAVSGRGVGMDVVRTNIERIGGAIEVSSVEGEGARFTIRIPLTLTIVSALIVECCGERFAMPQSAVMELVSASGGSGRTVEHLGGAAVLRLRDRLLPLVPLETLLGLERTGEPSPESCIVVARVGSFTFGVIVDRVFDTEEIVVKPVASVLRHLKYYSGATILGDGSVILILDFKGISLETGAGQAASSVQEVERAADAASGETAAMLVFRAAKGELKATPLASVARIEELAPAQLEAADGRSVIQYRGKLMPVVDVAAAPVKAWTGGETRPLLVFAREDTALGVLVDEIVDIVESAAAPELAAAGEGVAGSLIIAGKATELVDVGFYWSRVLNEAPAGPAAASAAPTSAPASKPPAKRLLLVDQSPFSQLLLGPLLSQAGYEVTVAAEPKQAMALYEAGERFHLIMADTSPDSPGAQAFALSLAQATDWHRTPMLGLALQTPGTPKLDSSLLLDAVSSALEQRGAA